MGVIDESFHYCLTQSQRATRVGASPFLTSEHLVLVEGLESCRGLVVGLPHLAGERRLAVPHPRAHGCKVDRPHLNPACRTPDS